MEALKEATPHFWETLNAGKLSEEHHKSLYKYYSRWCTRSTPFGRFSGVFTANLSNRTIFREAVPQFHTQPDILVKKSLSQPADLSDTCFYVNSSLYPLADKYYLLQYTDEKYRQISLERFDALDALLEAGAPGISYPALESLLAGHGFSKQEAGEFIRELVEEQVLFTDEEFRQSETLEHYHHRLQRNILPHFTPAYTFTTYPDGEIDRALIRDILDDIRKLGKFFKKEPNARLEAFRKEFMLRFEGEEIPLPEVLDPEFGIRYGTYNLAPAGPMLSELETPPEPSGAPSTLSDLLLDKYLECITTGGNQITFTAEELHTTTPEENLTAYIFGSLLRQGQDSLFLLKEAGGSSAVNLMSRFSLGHPPLAERLREITAYEQSLTDALLAEVIHLPDGKIGNVVLHAPLREHQIHYLGHDTGTPIPLSDLLVSVSGNEVILRSRKFNKRVIPYLSHAHNYSTGLPIYNFLGDLQPTGAHFSVNWGALRNREYLPRVVFGRLILWRATWNLSTKNFDQSTLPRHVVVVEADNELYLDLHEPIAQKILKDYLRKNEVVRIQEFLYLPDQCFIPNRASEIVIPVKGQNPKPFTRPVPLICGPSYPPGSEWLYLKLYTGPRMADNLLREKIRPFIRLLKEQGLIEKWFFIRYQDPGFHLRLRFYHSTHPGFYKTLLEMFHFHFHHELHSRLIQDFQVAQYKPEYSRYGDMQTAETLFMQDSELILERLESDLELYRLETSLTRTSFYLSGLPLAEKVSFCETQRDAFLQELGAALKPRLNNLYRRHRTWIEDTLSTVSHETIPSLKQETMASVIHMHVNRNFISESRKYELMLYHFLYRYYHSKNTFNTLLLK